MKHSNFFNYIKFIFLAFDLIFLTIVNTLLAKTNSVQLDSLQQSQSTTLEALRQEKAAESWLVLASLAGVAGYFGLAALRRKQRMILRKSNNSRHHFPDEDTYFG
jgi:hypothetical protein